MRESQHIRSAHGEYVYGNTVRKVDIDTRQRVYQDGKRVYASVEELKNRDRALQMNMIYVTFFAVVSVFFLIMGVTYLGIQNEITNTRDEITQLQTNINTLSAKNEAIDYSIDGYVSAEHILKVAKKELGMVEAGSDQVEFYKNSDSEYTVQFKDIPTK